MARTRTFLAIPMDVGIAKSAATLQANLALTKASVNWVAIPNLHITLQFLGELDDRDLVTVCRVVAKVCAPLAPFPLSIAGLDAFPNRRRPKTLWAGVTEGSEALVNLYEALDLALTESGTYRREERAYTPHLTLGRIPAEESGQMIAAEFAKHQTWSAGRMTVTEVVVYRSELRREGPEYSVLARGEFQG